MKPNLFRKLNPFKKKSPTDRLISTLTDSVTIMFQNQMNDTMASAMSSMAYELPRGNRQSDKDDSAEQNRIYASAISMTNGNRDNANRVPDPIGITSFRGDKMAPEQRHEAQDIIDTINEANEINSTGAYRTEDSIIEEHQEPSQGDDIIADMFKGIADFFAPIARSVAACLGAVVSILILTKMTKVVESIG